MVKYTMTAMRTFFFSAFLLLLASCEPPAKAAFEQYRGAVTELQLPALVHADSISGFKPVAIKKEDADLLFPPALVYSLYKNITCIAHSEVGNVHLLWFELSSDPEYDGSPDAKDIAMVIYDRNLKPVDVRCVSSRDAGFCSFSYVRTDSVFTVEKSGQDDDVITVKGIAITEQGFQSGPEDRKSFHSDELTGISPEARAYMDAFIERHQKH